MRQRWVRKHIQEGSQVHDPISAKYGIMKPGDLAVNQMMRSICTVVLLAALAQGLAACASGSGPGRTSPAPVAVTNLPPPILSSDLSLEETLADRRSVREYSDQPLTETEIGQLLWAAQGITSEQGYRTAPSAGALYPLEIYLVTADGVLHYDPRHHSLAPTGHIDARPALYEAALRQKPVLAAPAVFVISAVYARTAQKYGDQRGSRYVHIEAGHAAQNLLLQATALGLGAVPIGAFNDQEVQQALGLVEDHQPLYLLPVGHPGEPDQ